MQAQDVDDGDYFPLPPVKLPQLPPQVIKKPQQSIMIIPNDFKEEIQQVDTSSIETVQFLSGGTLLAVGCGSGSIKIVSPAQGNVQFILQGGDKSPVTGLAHNPNQTNIKNALMATHSEGTLQYWHATSRQLLFSKKYTEMLQTCQISGNGNYYAFSGGQGHIWFGHLTKGDPVQMEDGHMGKHENRVFCLKWNPEDENVVVSGGWDRSVHFWDIRMKTSIKQLFGYYIGGQAIDFRGNEVLLGNNKSDIPLRIYDSKADKVRSVNWPLTRISQINDTTGVLGCSFAGKKDLIACTPRNQVRRWSEVKWVSEFEKEIQEGQEGGIRLYCMQYSNLSDRLVTGWSDGCLRWLTL